MNQRGQVYPLFGFLLLTMVAMSALTIDMGYYRYQERLQQTATDSAALAGAQEIIWPTPNAANAAIADATTNGFGTAASATVSPNPNYSDAYTNGTGFQVSITKTYPKWFSGYFGGGTQSIGTTAVASLEAVATNCITQLDPNGSLDLHGQKMTGAGCSIQANGTVNCSGGNYSVIVGITVDETNNAGLSCKDGPSVGFTNKINNPCPNVTGCRAVQNLELTNNNAALGLSCIPNATTCVPNSGTAPHCSSPAATPAPGVTQVQTGCYDCSSYSGNSFNNNLVFDNTYGTQGIYTFINCAFGSGETTGTNGATFYLASGSTTALSGIGQDLGNSTTAFSGPTSSSSPYVGLLFYQPDSNTTNVDIGANIYTDGMWYFPGASYTENGHNTHVYTGDIVFDSITFNGGNTTTLYPGPADSPGTQTQARIVE